ncbi:MAG: hypothetical protein K2K50_06415, partial [Anaeroplasmataceae bacterium]|nr:hypothetical protein [Anaeroplasmataceae bacterium]
LFLLPLLLLFTGCFQKKAYIQPLSEGIYVFEEKFTLEEKEYTGSKLIISEISLKEFNQANKLNVLQDYALNVDDRKFYSFQFYFLEDQIEIPISMKFEKKCNPYATGPDIYIISLDVPNGDESKHYDADLHVALLGPDQPYYYYLSIDYGRYKSIGLKYLKA